MQPITSEPGSPRAAVPLRGRRIVASHQSPVPGAVRSERKEQPTDFPIICEAFAPSNTSRYSQCTIYRPAVLRITINYTHGIGTNTIGGGVI